MNNNHIELLQKLISTPSMSRNEAETATIIDNYLKNAGITSVIRKDNNVIVKNLYFNPENPTILLNSHHDTVKPNPGYTRNPFTPSIENGILYGLGSNDAGASVVSLISVFLHFYSFKNLKYNICLAITAEEEVSGTCGLAEVLPEIQPIDFAIIGEPTEMKMAVAERGLMVLDCVCHGKSGHAAREEGINSIYKAMKDIDWIRNYKFQRTSPLCGNVKMTVTVINAGEQHNVVPAECSFVVDVRSIEQYSNEEILQIIQDNLEADVKARSTRLKPSKISMDHPIVRIGTEMGIESYGSPTISDAVHLGNIPALKMGPGDSARSHTADEYVYIKEIDDAIEQYIAMLSKLIVS